MYLIVLIQLHYTDVEGAVRFAAAVQAPLHVYNVVASAHITRLCAADMPPLTIHNARKIAIGQAVYLVT